MALESFCERPQPGVIPTRAWVSAKRALVEQISTSQASATSNPPVIANLAHAERLERDGARWRLHMSEGAALPVSRSRLPALREALDPPPVRLRATA